MIWSHLEACRRHSAGTKEEPRRNPRDIEEAPRRQRHPGLQRTSGRHLKSTCTHLYICLRNESYSYKRRRRNSKAPKDKRKDANTIKNSSYA